VAGLPAAPACFFLTETRADKKIDTTPEFRYNLARDMGAGVRPLTAAGFQEAWRSQGPALAPLLMPAGFPYVDLCLWHFL
jgi:hypothetical protein